MTYGVIHLHQKGIMDIAGTLLSEETLCWIYCTFKHRKSPPLFLSIDTSLGKEAAKTFRFTPAQMAKQA
jgi:hypothetical protein